MIATRLSILGAALWIAAANGFPVKDPSNAATRACAKGFTQWCPTKRDDLNVSAGALVDPEQGATTNVTASFDDFDSDFSGFVGYKRADPIVNAATRACAKGFTEWCPTKRADTITNAATRACAKGFTEWCPTKRADTITNAATRACANGHTEWCVVHKREDDEELNFEMDDELKAELLQMIADESVETTTSATVKNNKRCGPPVVNAATRACANGHTEWCPTKRGDTVTNAATRACAKGRTEWCPIKRADTITNAATRACAKGFTEWCPVPKRELVEYQVEGPVLDSEFVEDDGFVAC